MSTAATLINSDIKHMIARKETYIIDDDLSYTESRSEFLPNTLSGFLAEMFVGKQTFLKVAPDGQCIVQAVHPRALTCPLQIAVAVQMDHNFSSRFLIDTLNSLGFCSSYLEVQLCKRCSAAFPDGSFDIIAPSAKKSFGSTCCR